ncbi:unnamed protein product [Lactuca virosa]|uniref:Uncharacterized protein n=1 Tax=Lactuca virosa TaxID=75947 RepID=A0AAU9PB77_9ASTR|nr:unnamed protein product [Lactuca virosa]
MPRPTQDIESESQFDSDSDEDEDEPISDAPIPDVVALVQQDPVMHPYHDMYMQEFQRLHDDNRHLHRNDSELYDSAFEINTEMVELRDDFYTFRYSQQARNQHVDTLITNKHRVLCLGGQPTRAPYYPQYPN